MKIEMFDSKTGNPAGEFEIPDHIIIDAYTVRDWMENNGMIQLAGLSLSGSPEGLTQRRRKVSKQEQVDG
jgi:hypothetical protein